jgi:hypothetical protein
MSRPPDQPGDRSARATASSDTAIAVVSAYGAFRLLLILLATWTAFAGFAMLTQSVDALTLGASESSTERVAGAYMLVLAPVFALLAWRRQQYRLFIWVPYAAQLAIILPLLWGILTGDGDAGDGLLLLIVSVIFLVLLVYLWWDSHPLGWFEPDAVDGEEEEDEEEEAFDEDDAYAEDSEEDPAGAESARRRRYRRT